MPPAAALTALTCRSAAARVPRVRACARTFDRSPRERAHDDALNSARLTGDATAHTGIGANSSSRWVFSTPRMISGAPASPYCGSVTCAILVPHGSISMRYPAFPGGEYIRTL